MCKLEPIGNKMHSEREQNARHDVTCACSLASVIKYDPDLLSSSLWGRYCACKAVD